jgi:uncharacterized protein YhfF
VHPSVQRLWARYQITNPDAAPDPPAAFHFCDNQKDADVCAALVAEGRNCATAPALAELRLTGDPLPKAGDLAIVTNWAGEAKALIRTCSAEIRRFGEVDAVFARAEGEGDGSLSWWRTAHRDYYTRVLAGSGHTVDDNLAVVCERFELLLTG